MRAKDRLEWEAREHNEDDDDPIPQKRLQLDIQETTEFVCGT